MMIQAYLYILIYIVQYLCYKCADVCCIIFAMQEQFLKLLLIGDSGVGKSCILSRFCDNKFTDAFYNTIGVDFKTKTITLQGRLCKLQIWDTAGQQRFRTITSNYYKGAHGVLVVFDLTNLQSLRNVTYWLEEIEKHGNLHVCTILIGNKNDLTGKQQVSQEEANNFARKHKLDYIECSALNALNIQLVFETIIKKVMRERSKKESAATSTGSSARLSGGEESRVQKRSCC